MPKEITLERSSKDYYGKQNVKITIGKEEVEIPIVILEDFIKDEKIIKSYIPIPD